MSARDAKISRRWLLAGGSAFGWGRLSAPASSQTPEKITYLFPAPPILPAFGPVQLDAPVGEEVDGPGGRDLIHVFQHEAGAFL